MANWFALIAFGGSPCKHSSYKKTIRYIWQRDMYVTFV